MKTYFLVIAFLISHKHHVYKYECNEVKTQECKILKTMDYYKIGDTVVIEVDTMNHPIFRIFY